MNDPVREKMLQGRAQAEDPQPFRCVKCGEAVSHIRWNDCACLRAVRDAESLASYAEECRAIGQGINTKESVQFRHAMARIKRDQLLDVVAIAELWRRWGSAPY